MIRVGLDLPHGGGMLERLIAGHVTRHAGIAPPPGGDLSACFEDAYFGLAQTAPFADASESGKDDIRRACAAAVLEEAYLIEKAGLAFGARMLLEAEDASRRQIYALLTGDEATHLSWLTPYVEPQRRTANEGPFIRLIERLIGEGPNQPLVFVLQVILEGWGLDHYRGLAEATRDPCLGQIFRAILKDEALHHRAGSVMLAPDRFSAADRAFTIETLGAFLEMVACGPLRVASVLAHAGGETGAAGLADLHRALGGEADARRKLALLRSLMRVEGMAWAAEALEARGAFRPLTAKQAASLV